MNFYLYGMKCCGKSTLGKKLAESLNREWIDTDKMIECAYADKTGRYSHFSDIHKEMGADAFFHLEEQMIHSIQSKSAVVSLGGSALSRKANAAFCQSSGFLIYLFLSPNAWLERLDRFIDKNSIFSSQSKRDRQSYYSERHALYASLANFILPTDGNSINQTLKALLCAVDDIKKNQHT